MKRSVGDKNRARLARALRRRGRHRLKGRPARGLEWVVENENGRGGRHRIPGGTGGGLLAAGAVLLATSAAAAPAGPVDAPDIPRATGGDRPPVTNRYQVREADGGTRPTAPTPPVTGAVNTVDDGPGPTIPAVFTGDIPTTVLNAYRNAHKMINLAQPGCRLPLELLAAIGKVETGHARRGWVDAHGTTVQQILGPILDGNGFAAIRDTDGGAFDGNTIWDRAVGPMQFIPGTWKRWASDGNGDNRADPHNVFDASLAAARYLCAANRDLGTPEGLNEAIFSYNHSISYRNLVLSWMSTYANGTTAIPDSGVDPVTILAAPPAPPATTTPPTSTPPSTPPGTTPPGTTPPGTTPPGTTPPGTTPPGTTPPGTTPPGTTPPTTPPPSTPPPSEPPPSTPPTTPPATPPTEPGQNPVGGLLCGVQGTISGILPLLPPCPGN